LCGAAKNHKLINLMAMKRPVNKNFLINKASIIGLKKADYL